MKFFLPFAFLIPMSIFSDTTIPPLTEMMSVEDQKKTGIIRLKQHEKAALAAWLYEHCFAKEPHSSGKDDVLKVSINIDDGKKLQLTDDSIWEVDPQDLSVSSTWIGDIDVKIYSSGNRSYPYFIINTKTNHFVRARKISSI